MKEPFEVPEQYFRSLTTIGFALLMGQIFFGIAVYFIITNDPTGAPDIPLVQLMMYIVPSFMIGGTAMGILLFNAKINSIREMDLSDEKLNAYRTATILRLALLEIPAFFAFTAVIATHQLIFYTGAGIMILLFAVLLPTRNRISSDLGI